MDFFKFKDGQDFLEKTGMNSDEAIAFLEQELKSRKKEQES
jgi:hypothetical protein